MPDINNLHHFFIYFNAIFSLFIYRQATLSFSFHIFLLRVGVYHTKKNQNQNSRKTNSVQDEIKEPDPPQCCTERNKCAQSACVRVFLGYETKILLKYMNIENQ